MGYESELMRFLYRACCITRLLQSLTELFVEKVGSSRKRLEYSAPCSNLGGDIDYTDWISYLTLVPGCKCRHTALNHTLTPSWNALSNLHPFYSSHSTLSSFKLSLSKQVQL
jgi:hypothetical protein